MNFSEDDARKMRALQSDLTTVLLRAKAHGLSPWIAAFALIRCARLVLTSCEPKTRQMLSYEVFAPFLNGEPGTDERLM